MQYHILPSQPLHSTSVEPYTPCGDIINLPNPTLQKVPNAALIV
ncbi:hypothetical protein F383_29243 [Gossypium arboreum]|uniref:Uncharacterized protein n=1 Tax=Gossypium arboreum TaxID=29729 RepID=A0A0B0MRZ9_GOSAR|nr:hypothetical protein F383_29243 [Gossypium arboreum]